MANAAKLQQYVYLSTACKLFSEAELDELLESARAFNARHEVTGLLVYADGNFFQALEGEPPAIERVLDRIRRDPRHHNMIRVLCQEIAARSFPDWSMGYRRMSYEQGLHDGWFDYGASDAKAWERMAGAASPAMMLARSFLNANR